MVGEDVPAGRSRANRKRIALGTAAVGLVAAAATVGVLVFTSSGGNSAPRPSAASSVVRAVEATAKAHARRFTVTGQLTKAVAAYFGGSAVTGAGVADFADDIARWRLTVPPQVGGVIAVVAKGNRTWVDVGARGRYVLLTSDADYRAYDSVPLVRDLVEVTNPFRDLNLAESTPARVQRKHLSLAPFDAPVPSRPGVHLVAAVHRTSWRLRAGPR